MQTAKTLIRLGGCPGWSAQQHCWFCHEAAHITSENVIRYYGTPCINLMQSDKVHFFFFIGLVPPVIRSIWLNLQVSYISNNTIYGVGTKCGYHWQVTRKCIVWFSNICLQWSHANFHTDQVKNKWHRHSVKNVEPLITYYTEHSIMILPVLYSLTQNIV